MKKGLLLFCNSPREQRKVKSEKKWYFLAKMIKISPKGTHFLFSFHSSLFTLH